MEICKDTNEICRMTALGQIQTISEQDRPVTDQLSFAPEFGQVGLGEGSGDQWNHCPSLSVGWLAESVYASLLGSLSAWAGPF